MPNPFGITPEQLHDLRMQQNQLNAQRNIAGLQAGTAGQQMNTQRSIANLNAATELQRALYGLQGQQYQTQGQMYGQGLNTFGNLQQGQNLYGIAALQHGPQARALELMQASALSGQPLTYAQALSQIQSGGTGAGGGGTSSTPPAGWRGFQGGGTGQTPSGMVPMAGGPLGSAGLPRPTGTAPHGLQAGLFQPASGAQQFTINPYAMNEMLGLPAGPAPPTPAPTMPLNLLLGGGIHQRIQVPLTGTNYPNEGGPRNNYVPGPPDAYGNPTAGQWQTSGSWDTPPGAWQNQAAPFMPPADQPLVPAGPPPVLPPLTQPSGQPVTPPAAQQPNLDTPEGLMQFLQSLPDRPGGSNVGGNVPAQQFGQNQLGQQADQAMNATWQNLQQQTPIQVAAPSAHLPPGQLTEDQQALGWTVSPMTTGAHGNTPGQIATLGGLRIPPGMNATVAGSVLGNTAAENWPTEFLRQLPSHMADPTTAALIQANWPQIRTLLATRYEGGANALNALIYAHPTTSLMSGSSGLPPNTVLEGLGQGLRTTFLHNPAEMTGANYQWHRQLNALRNLDMGVTGSDVMGQGIASSLGSISGLGGTGQVLPYGQPFTGSFPVYQVPPHWLPGTQRPALPVPPPAQQTPLPPPQPSWMGLQRPSWMGPATPVPAGGFGPQW